MQKNAVILADEWIDDVKLLINLPVVSSIILDNPTINIFDKIIQMKYILIVLFILIDKKKVSK